jgi:DNA-binding NarL/FixJ family response regulator
VAEGQLWPFKGATEASRISQTRPVRPISELPLADRIRVVVADGDRLFARALAERLLRHLDCEVVGIAKDGAQAFALVHEFLPDVLVLDAALPLRERLEAKEWGVRGSAAPAVILLMPADGRAADCNGFETGASVYARKSVDLVNSIDLLVAMSHLTALSYAAARAGG